MKTENETAAEAALPPATCSAGLRAGELCQQCSGVVTLSDTQRLDWMLKTLCNGGPRGLAAAISHRDDMERPILDRVSIDAVMTKPNPKLRDAADRKL